MSLMSLTEPQAISAETHQAQPETGAEHVYVGGRVRKNVCISKILCYHIRVFEVGYGLPALPPPHSHGIQPQRARIQTYPPSRQRACGAINQLALGACVARQFPQWSRQGRMPRRFANERP